MCKPILQRVVAVTLCFGILFSTLVDATSHAAHAGHGHTPHSVAIAVDTGHTTITCEQSGSDCLSENDQRSGADKHGLLDPAHCGLVFVWLPIPELIAPGVRRLPLIRYNDAMRATIFRDFERPPKSLL